MRFSILLTLFQPLLAWFVNAERKLPADLQVDLIFPRNETYAPTQWFPIIFGVQNLDALWPLDIRLAVTVWSVAWRLSGNQSAYWQYEDFTLSLDKFSKLVGPTPSKQFFHIPAINMTNGTTDKYNILWEIEVMNRCYSNNTNPFLDVGGDSWSNRRQQYFRQYLQFSTAPGAQLPDIEATINSCPEPNENTSAAVRVTEVRKTRDEGKNCPVLETNVTSNKCNYKPVAAELAANVSTMMLGNMRCDEGTWQTITTPCPRRKSIASSQIMEFGVGWVLALAFAAVLNIL